MYYELFMYAFSDGFVLRVEQIEGICEDIRSRYLDADFHV